MQVQSRSLRPSVRTASGSDRTEAYNLFGAFPFAALIRSLPLAVLTLGLLAAPVSAQELRVLIRVVPESNRVIIEGSCAPTKVWSFRNSYAGILGLGARVERFRLLDNVSIEVPSRKIAPGQFASDASASRFQYEVSLTLSAAASDAVKVSWLNTERG